LSIANDNDVPDAATRDAAMVEALAHVLGNTCRLFRASLCGRWNTVGPGAQEFAILCEAQAREMFEGQFPTADRIRLLSGPAVPDDSDNVVVGRPAELDFRQPTPIRVARMLADGHESAILSIEAACDVAEEIGDKGTHMVLNQRLIAHQGHLVALRRILA
jgi:DNA-binding ferritin-like protein